MKYLLCSLFILVLLATTAGATRELTGDYFVVLGEDAPSTDVLTGVNVIQLLKAAGAEIPVGAAVEDSEAVLAFSKHDIDERVFFVIDGNHIGILIGPAERASHEEMALLVQELLEDKGYDTELNYNPSREDLLVTSVMPEEKDDEDSQPVACTMDVKQCTDGSYVGRVAPDCAFEECPEYVPELPEEQEVVCQGCLQDDECIAYGAIIAGQRYCADDGVVSAQKEVGMSCANNYECKNNNCIENECEVIKVKSKNVIVRFFSWLGGLFG